MHLHKLFLVGSPRPKGNNFGNKRAQIPSNSNSLIGRELATGKLIEFLIISHCNSSLISDSTNVS